LVLATGCAKTDAPHPASDPPASKTDADIRVLATTRLFADANEHLRFAHALPEGGFLAATGVRGGADSVYRLASNGSVLWRTPLPERTHPFSGGVTGDGQYWLGGSGGDSNSDVVQIVSKDGALTGQNMLSHTTADNRFLICASERDHKYLQIIPVGLDEYSRIPVSSMSMTDPDGVRLWEKLTPFDQQRRIAPTPQQFLSCAGLFVTGDDHVLAAQRILVWPETHSAGEIEKEWASGTQQRPATLVLDFDLAGHEIARLRDDDTVGGLLIPSPDGAVLFESTYLKPGLASAAPVDAHVHIRWLNSSLRDITPPLIIPDGSLDVINAAYLTPQGGLLMAGCSGTTSRMFVRHVSKDRAVSPKQELTQLGYCGGTYWFAMGAHPNEALLLSEAAPGLGSFVTAVRISE
jgi:hypothetical protein